MKRTIEGHTVVLGATGIGKTMFDYRKYFEKRVFFKNVFFQTIERSCEEVKKAHKEFM